MDKKFNVFLPVDIQVKSIEGSTKKRHVATGTGSTIKKDRQGEKLSEKALSKLESISNEKRIPVFSDHNHSWENTMGYISTSKATEGKWDVAIDLEDPLENEKVAKLISKKEHGTPIGLSIGGRVLDSHYDKSEGTAVRVIDDIELFELSFVGIPANEDGSVISYIAKSLEGEVMVEQTKAEPVVETKVVETVKAVEEPKQAEIKEDYVSKKEMDEMKKGLLEEISKQIASIQPVKKSVVEETAKEQLLQGTEAKAVDVDAKFDAAIKKRYGM
jgi:HK97 family phage prohead protease